MSGRSTAGGGIQSFDEVVINPGGKLTFGTSATVNGLLLANDGLRGTITVPSGMTLTLDSGATFSLNGQNITTTGNVACGTVTASGLVNAQNGLTMNGGGTANLAGSTISGQPTWSSGQTFPGVTCPGNWTMTSGTVVGQPTWGSSQTIPGVNTTNLTTTGNVTIGTGGLAVTSHRTIVLKYTGSTGLFTIVSGNGSDSVSGGGNAALTLYGYSTWRTSINYVFGTAMSTANYFIVGTAGHTSTALQSFKVLISQKATTGFRVALVREDSNSFDVTFDVFLSLLVIQ